ncbi:MAG: tetratricopeptide repeat protein [Solirubrobacterales bacterium]
MRIAAVSAALLATVLAGPALAKQPAAPAQKPAAAAPKAPQPAAKEAKPSMATLAALGDAKAQFAMGQALIRKSPAEALEWFGLAAAGGLPEAAIEVAKAFEQGAGTLGKNPTEAARWWYLAGMMGSEPAQARFLDLFLSGQAPAVGGAEVVRWLAPRVAQGDVRAMLALGAMYENPRGPVYNPAQAEHWYMEAALAGDAEAQFRLGRLALRLPGQWRVVTDKEKGEFRVFASKQAAREAGFEPDVIEITRPGMLAAEHWLTAAARQDHAEAQYMLGTVKLAGIELPFDLEGGTRWLEAAAEQNHPAALAALADLAAKGQGFHGSDPVFAWACLDLAIQAGRKDATEIRDALGKSMNGRQLNRARQIAQDLREIRGM